MNQVSQSTSGEWHVGGREQCTIYDKFGQRIANTFEGVMVSQRSDAECQANASLIAEAGAVHHETGLTPRQLFEQRDALIKALARIDAIEDKMSGGDWDEIIEARAVARAALALVKGEPK